MKTLVSLFLMVLVTTTFGQVVFKDGKKYGISKNGKKPDKENKDSLIFRADYDDIEIINDASLRSFVFTASRNDEWSFLTPNKLVNQQRYETIFIPEDYPDFMVALRDGYIDILDLKKVDFLIRGVRAENLVKQESFENPGLIMTHQPKEFYGIVHIESKKEILKCEYARIYANSNLPNTVIAFKAGVTFLFDTSGKLMFQLNSAENITDITESPQASGAYDILAQTKKDQMVGFYYPKEKWFVEPIYSEVSCIDGDPAVVVVKNAKGEKGVFFQGEQILPCEYLDVRKGEQQGVLAIVTSKKGEFNLFDDGKLVPKTQ